MKPMRGTIRRKGFLLRPPEILTARFDLVDHPTAYLGDSEETALYENLLASSMHRHSI